MSNFYDDSKFGVITRKWFGQTPKHGGESANGYTFGTTDATVISHLARHYPKGPIAIQKIGAQVLATIGGGSAAFDVIPTYLTKNGSRVSTFTFNISDAGAAYSVASVEPTAEQVIDAGSYYGFETATPQSDSGTDYNTATVTGTVAFFVDWRPVWIESNKWDTTPN